MIGVFHIGMKRGVEEAVLRRVDAADNRGNAERAHGVPDTDHGDGGVVHGVLLAKRLQLLLAGVLIAFVIGVERQRHQAVVNVLRGQSADGDHAGQTARRKSPAAETKEEELVVLLIKMGNARVPVLELLLETEAHCSAVKFIALKILYTLVLVAASFQVPSAQYRIRFDMGSSHRK